MSILAWIEDQRRLKLLNAPKYNHPASDGSKGLWTRCDNCGVILYIKHLRENQRVCFGCGYHLQMDSQERIEHLIDDNTWRPLDETLSPCDPLEFRDQKPYTERLREAQERTGLQDAVQTGTGLLDGIPIALGVMDFNFMGGSMGSVVGEKITRLIEYAAQEGLTLVLVCASGGARMQEGIFSLMQMAKISSALQIYQSCANLLYISVLTSPTTGGVTASFAMLGDLIFAEPKALIGFAGRRVIEQTLQEDLPDDFQTSEYLLHHGLLDLIVPRCFLKQALSETITLYKDAPFKRVGSIPYGVQSPLNLLTEERIRRRWERWTSSLYGAISTTNSFLGDTSSTVKGGQRPPDASEWHGIDGPSAEEGGAIRQLWDLRLPEPTSGSGDDDRHLIEALSKWLLDTSSDEHYRDILMSFQAMFSLFARHDSSPASAVNLLTPQLSGEDRSSRPEQNNIVDASEAIGGPRSFSLPHHDGGGEGYTSDLINLAFEVSANEAIGWRAFYTTHKASPKMALFSHMDLSRPSPMDKAGLDEAAKLSTSSDPSDATHPSPTPRRGVGLLDPRPHDWGTNQFGRLDRQFLYSMLVNRVNPHDGWASPPPDSTASLLPSEPSLEG